MGAGLDLGVLGCTLGVVLLGLWARGGLLGDIGYRPMSRLHLGKITTQDPMAGLGTAF